MIPLIVLVALAASTGSAGTGKPSQPYVDLQPIGFPVVLQGRLVNYVFADIRLLLAPGVDASKLQQQEPVLRDMLVREAAHVPLNPPDDGLRLDETRLRAEVMKDAVSRFGPGKVATVLVRSQTPQRRSGVPGRPLPPPPLPGSGGPLQP